MRHPFGELLTLYRTRKHGLSQARLSQILGYDPAVIARMARGQKDLTGPTGREKVVRIIAALHNEGVLHTLDEANMLLAAANMPPLYEGLPAEAALIDSLRPAASPTPASRSGIPHNLPAPLTSFIGREQEVAAEALDRFEDGAWLVELAAISEPKLVADAVAAALGLRPTSRPALDVLMDYLHGKRLLLILDNCEHLIAACAALADSLVHACAHLHILATSRELLNIAGEMTWRVPSLAAETAVQLFVDRARAARPHFKLDEQNAGSITRICERLDGIPLAIELAAARLRAFSIEQIATRLDDRFQLLTDGSRTSLLRHQTLRGLIDWSYGLLTTHERILLRQVSVFAGGWTLEAAETICRKDDGPFVPRLSLGMLRASSATGDRFDRQSSAIRRHDVPDLLARLVNKSLVTMSETPTGPRYGLHETIRQYALEKLVEAGEEERTRQRHLDFFARLAEEANLDWHRAAPTRRPWLDRIQADLDNFRAALERTVQTRDVVAGERLINGLWQFWRSRSDCIEGINWINAVLIHPSQPDERAYAVGRIKAAYLVFLAGNQVQATIWYEEALPLARALDDRELVMFAAQGVGFMIPDYEQSIQWELEAIRLAEELGWDDVKTDSLYMLGVRMQLHGDYDGATRMLMDGLRLARDRHDFSYSWCTYGLGLIALERGDNAQARTWLEAGMVFGREWDDSIFVARAQIALAEVALHEQREDEVVRLIKECITAMQKMGNLERIVQCLSIAAGVSQVRGQLALAVRWLGVASVVRRDFSGHTWWKPAMYAEYERRLKALREVVATAEFDRAWAEGERMTLAQAVDEVLGMSDE